MSILLWWIWTVIAVGGIWWVHYRFQRTTWFLHLWALGFLAVGTFILLIDISIDIAPSNLSQPLEFLIPASLVGLILVWLWSLFAGMIWHRTFPTATQESKRILPNLQIAEKRWFIVAYLNFALYTILMVVTAMLNLLD